MKTLSSLIVAAIALVTSVLFVSPTWALDVQMGFDGNLVFEPSEITINAGESVHFVNNMLPPHNVIVENRDDISHDALAMMPGEEFDVTFPDAGDFNFWCGPHQGAGMTGVVHVQ